MDYRMKLLARRGRNVLGPRGEVFAEAGTEFYQDDALKAGVNLAGQAASWTVVGSPETSTDSVAKKEPEAPVADESDDNGTD